MAIGDAALAAGMDLVPGSLPANQIDTEMNKTRDYVANRTAIVSPLNRGGTGASTAAGARNNLGINAANTPSNGVLGTGAGTNNLQADVEYLYDLIEALQARVTALGG